ncbi:MAG: NADH-quinone oxidoreductase subunit C [Dehalococcoidales bacterium]|nr:NADH-quinone oxidoreductase subunit C [Dehalococcoidales bacterium]
MTKPVATKELADRLEREFQGCIIESSDKDIVVKAEFVSKIALYLKDTPGLEFDYLNYVTAVDYKDYFMVVYNLISLKNNASLILKTRCDNRENPTVPSVVGVWKGADFQEREIYDLMGIRFENHPDLKRIFLWDGFAGYPLRKDFVNQ